MKYCIAKSHYTNRPNFYDHHQKADTIITWIPVPFFGYHDSNVKAKLSFLIGMQVLTENVDYTDKYIVGCFKMFQNLKHYKVVKIKEEEIKNVENKNS